MIFSIFVKRKNMSFICGQHQVWQFRRKNLYSHAKAVFSCFSPLFKEFIKGVKKKCQKTQCNGQYDIFLRNFYTRCSPQIKDTFFLFTKIQKINSKSLKRKNAFSFLNFTHFLGRLRTVLRSVNGCSVKDEKIEEQVHKYHITL